MNQIRINSDHIEYFHDISLRDITEAPLPYPDLIHSYVCLDSRDCHGDPETIYEPSTVAELLESIFPRQEKEFIPVRIKSDDGTTTGIAWINRRQVVMTQRMACNKQCMIRFRDRSYLIADEEYEATWNKLKY